ncbi:PLDc N-terminal domain-containing protein [Paenarthrobacter sp. NPDC056912]|uniref:PLDc N-terminal domain-containing protein n=1 Tax=Paenarthrobacter sp. NPDC056912 TaxID=3345965 RepID=UPI00366F97FA
MGYFENIWTIFWGVAGLLILFAFLSALFTIIGDVFRDQDLSGWAKGGWMLLLIFLPLLGVLLYLIVRGRGMNDRSGPQSRHSYFDPGNRYDSRFII